MSPFIGLETKAFGAMGALSHPTHIYYQNIMELETLGSVIDLVAASVREYQPDETKIRGFVSELTLLSHRMSDPLAVSSAGLTLPRIPPLLELGWDEEKIALSVAFHLTPQFALRADALSERIAQQRPLNPFESSLVTLDRYCDQLILRYHPRVQKFEALGLVRRQKIEAPLLPPKEAPWCVFFTAEDPHQGRPREAAVAYVELGDTPFNDLLHTRGNTVIFSSETAPAGVPVGTTAALPANLIQDAEDASSHSADTDAADQGAKADHPRERPSFREPAAPWDRLHAGGSHRPIPDAASEQAEAEVSGPVLAHRRGPFPASRIIVKDSWLDRTLASIRKKPYRVSLHASTATSATGKSGEDPATKSARLEAQLARAMEALLASKDKLEELKSLTQELAQTKSERDQLRAQLLEGGSAPSASGREFRSERDMEDVWPRIRNLEAENLTLQRQAEEFKRSNQILVGKLQEFREGMPEPEGAQMAQRLDAAMKLALYHQLENQRLQQELDQHLNRAAS